MPQMISIWRKKYWLFNVKTAVVVTGTKEQIKVPFKNGFFVNCLWHSPFNFWCTKSVWSLLWSSDPMTLKVLTEVNGLGNEVCSPLAQTR